MGSETWMFKNERKTLFLTLDERGSHGYVIAPDDTPPIRFATDDDAKTNQYDSARLVRRTP